MKALFYLLLSALYLSLVSCDNLFDNLIQAPSRVLLVYMGGDNNLSGENVRKIEALRLACRRPGERVLIYSDERGRPPRLLEITPAGNGEGVVRQVRAYAESNSASAMVLAEVLETVRCDYPASSYGMIVFSHASGWLPEGRLLNPTFGKQRSVIIDGLHEMELVDFAAAIPDGMFNFIVFETCFMGGVETMYELRHKAAYIVASSTEMLSPGLLPVYGDIFPLLFQPEADLQGVAQRYFAYYNAREGDDRSATIAVVRTDGLDELAEAAATALTETMTGDVGDIQHFDRYAYRLFFDFGDAYARVLDKEAFGRLQRQLDHCILYKAATPSFIPGQGGFTITHFSGLSTYIEQPEFPSLNEQYRRLAWYQRMDARPEYRL